MRATIKLPNGSEKQSWKQTAYYILQSTHLVPCLSTTIFTMLMAYISGQRLQLLILLPAVLLGQFTVGWYNDYLDRDNDRIAGRKDKPIALGLVSARAIAWVAIPSFILSILLGFAYSVPAGIVYTVAMASALLYDYHLKKTVFSIVTLLVCFGLLPVVIGLGAQPAYIPATWMIVAGALLGACIHFLNVIPDFADDKKTGVKGFVHYFTYNQALFIGAGLLVLSSLSVVLGIKDTAGPLLWVFVAAFVITSGAFLRSFLQDDMKEAFKYSKFMTLITIFILLLGAAYMH